VLNQIYFGSKLHVPKYLPEVVEGNFASISSNLDLLAGGNIKKNQKLIGISTDFNIC